MIFAIYSFLPFSSISSADPPDCSKISCDQWCPHDSELIRHGASSTTWPSVIGGDATDISTMDGKVKRAVASYGRREIIKITPGGYDDKRRRRRRRQIETNDFVTLTEYDTPEEKARATCCTQKAINYCQCNYATCKDVECEANESKILLQSDSNVPGNCCPVYLCSSRRVSCYSSTLKRHFLVNETWNEDDCTHCECGEKGDAQCRSSVCKAISCEKQIRKAGQCCPECDFSDSKYCKGHEACDIHCRYGFDINATNGCTICRCANMPTTSTSTTSTTSTTTSTLLTHASSNNDDTLYNVSDNNRSSVAPTSTDDNWFVPSPVILGICITIAAFVIVVSLSCRYMTHNKGKHRLNRKQKNNNLTPLI